MLLPIRSVAARSSGGVLGWVCLYGRRLPGDFELRAEQHDLCLWSNWGCYAGMLEHVRLRRGWSLAVGWDWTAMLTRIADADSAR